MVRSQEPHSLTIGKLASRVGVGVETIRFYQRKGLLETPNRDGGIRRYGSEDLRQLRFIRLAQSAGFTLDEIGELFELDSSEDRERVRAMAEARISALDARIAEMKAARDSLVRLARQCAGGTKGPCPILQSFESPA